MMVNFKIFGRKRDYSDLTSKIFFVLLMVGVSAFSDKGSTIKYFYLLTVIFCLYTFIGMILQNRLIVNKFVFAVSGFLFWMILSGIWQSQKVLYESRVITVFMILILVTFVSQWFHEDGWEECIIDCLIITGMINSMYRLLTGGIAQITSSNFYASETLIVGANSFGVAIVVSFACSTYKLITNKKLIYIVCTVVFLSMAFLTGSRKAMIGCVIVIIMQYMFSGRAHKIRNLFVLVMAVIIMYWLLSSVDVFSYAYSRFEQMIAKTDSSTVTRTEMIEYGISQFAKNPLIGYGVGFSQGSHYGVYLHNNFIEIGVSLGVIGLILFYWPHISIIVSAVKYRARIHCEFVLPVITAFLFMDYGMVSYFDKFYYLIICIIYMISKSKKRSGTSE